MMTKNLMVGFVVLFSSLQAGAAQKPDVKFGWSTLEAAPLTSFIKVTGRVVPKDGALNIESARIQGRVLAIEAREGDVVKPGSPLFLINSAECMSLGEEKRVAEKRNIADLLEGVKRRESQLGLRISNGKCQIVATFHGVITKRNFESGAAFNVGDALLTLIDTKRLSVELDVPEREVTTVQPGQRVTYRLATETEKTYESVVKAVVPSIDSASRTARVRLNGNNLPSSASLDGLVFGEIENKSSDPVFVVPSQALVFSKNARYVIRGPEKKAASVEVVVLSEANGQSSIRAKNPGDLKASDAVATNKAIFLYRKLAEGNLQP